MWLSLHICRWLIIRTILGLLIAPLRVRAQHLPLPPLNYNYDALEPFIDEATMRVHHLGHHQAYTNKINEALQSLRSDPDTKALAKMGIDKLLQHLDEVPSKLRGTVRNNGGGYVNHELFWQSMAKHSEGSDKPSEAKHPTIAKQLVQDFGSLENFMMEFSQAAKTLFGSGWTWLAYDKEAKTLLVTTTPNQDTPLSDHPNYAVILNLDVWEHAYYLKYRNKRPEYVAAFWRIVNWDKAEERLRLAMGLTTGKATEEL